MYVLIEYGSRKVFSFPDHLGGFDRAEKETNCGWLRPPQACSCRNLRRQYTWRFSIFIPGSPGWEFHRAERKQTAITPQRDGVTAVYRVFSTYYFLSITRLPRRGISPCRKETNCGYSYHKESVCSRPRRYTG